MFSLVLKIDLLAVSGNKQTLSNNAHSAIQTIQFFKTLW